MIPKGAEHPKFHWQFLGLWVLNNISQDQPLQNHLRVWCANLRTESWTYDIHFVCCFRPLYTWSDLQGQCSCLFLKTNKFVSFFGQDITSQKYVWQSCSLHFICSQSCFWQLLAKEQSAAPCLHLWLCLHPFCNPFLQQWPGKVFIWHGEVITQWSHCCEKMVVLMSRVWRFSSLHTECVLSAKNLHTQGYSSAIPHQNCSFLTERISDTDIQATFICLNTFIVQFLWLFWWIFFVKLLSFFSP